MTAFRLSMHARHSIPMFVAALLGTRAFSMETSTALWNEYIAAPDNHSHIANGSYAGYRHGETPPPVVPVVVNVLDFGAVADGDTATPTNNYAAFRRAIDAAASRGGGAVLVPAGTFMVDNIIRIRHSGVVLRGAGQGLTILKFNRNLTQLFGAQNLGSSSRWNWSGALVWLAPDTNHTTNATWNWVFSGANPTGYSNGGPAQAWEYFHHGALATNVNLTSPAEVPRGGRVIPVADATKIQEGEYYLMTWENTVDNSLLREIGEHPLLAGASSASFGSWMTDCSTTTPAYTGSYPRWQWPVQIASVDTLNNTVTLKQPLRVAAKAQWNCQFLEMGKTVRESGVEDLTISLTGTASLGHNAGFGWNGVYVSKALNCWVRNVNVQNGESGIIVTGSKNISMLNTSVGGTMPMHHPYATRCEVQDCLWDGFEINITAANPGPIHGINTEWLSAGNVWTRGNMHQGTFDSHSGLSFDYLRTDITMENDSTSGPGGASQAGFYTGRRVAHWNVDIHDCDRPADKKGIYVYQPRQFVRSALCGIRGAQVDTGEGFHMPAGDKDVRLADEGIIPTTAPNLYDAELQLRKDQEGLAQLTWPNNGIHLPGDVTLKAAAAAKTGRTITKVEYLADNTVVATATSAPWDAVWINASAGGYSMRVRVTDSETQVQLSPRTPLTIGWRYRIEDNHPGWTYGGTGWTTMAGPAFSNGFIRKQGSGSPAGQSASFSFTGTRIRFVTGSGGGNQINDVYLDDMSNKLLTLPGLQDNYYDHELWNSGVLPNGAHTVKFVRTNESLNIDYIEVDSTVPVNMPPEAMIQAAPPTGFAPMLVNFTSTGSNDRDGTIASYDWDFTNDGTTDATGPTATFTYPTPGTYYCKLTITDNGGATGVFALQVIATDPVPTAVFTTTPASGDAPLLVNFDGSSSSSPLPERTITAWEWDFTNDGTYDATGATTTFTYLLAGSYTAKLRVTDSTARQSTTTRTLTVIGNIPPVVNAGNDATVTTATLPGTRTMIATVTDDGKPTGNPLTYAWTQLSGPGTATFGNASALTPVVTFPAAGVYVLQLSGSDGELAATDTVQITVVLNNTQPFLEKAGTLCLEAENFTRQDPRSDEANMFWIKQNTTTGFSGTGYITTNLATAANGNGTWANSCLAEYDAIFETAGTYYIFVLRNALDGGKNSGYVGVDGTQYGGHDNDASVIGSWTWRSPGTVTISAAQLGAVKKIQVVRREAGYKIDKIVLSTTNTPPTGFGPPESPHQPSEPSVPTFSSWINGYPNIPVADRDPQDDPDHDSIPNLIEYNAGTSPSASNGSPLRLISATPSIMTIEWVRRKQAPGLTEAVHYSPNLSTPFQALDAQHSATYQVLADDGQFQTVRALVTRLSGEARLFLRLNVQLE